MSCTLDFLRRLEKLARCYPDRIAAADEDRQITYRQMETEAARVYHALKAEGIGREDCVQIVMKRSVSFFPCIIGILKAGACFVALEEGYPPDRIELIRQDAGCVKVIDDAAYQQIQTEMDPLPGCREAGIYDAAYLVYTSGSTGNPKGIIHEYGNIDQQASCFPEQEEYPEFRQGFVPPFYFVAAITQMIEYFVKGRSLYIVSRSLLRNLPDLLQYIDRKKLQGIYLSPSYLRLCNPADTTLEIVQTGSEPAGGIYYPSEHMQIWNVYLMSECGFELLKQPLDQRYEPAPVGKPVLDVDLHLVDEEGNRVEGPGQGEICFRNEYVRGYLHLPEKTAEVFRNGYYYTGDLARRDEQGRYYILGRKDDMIKINGNRVEPAEIEKRVKEITGLEQVVAKGFRRNGRAFVVVFYLNKQAQALNLLQNGKLTVDPGSLSRVLPEYMIPSFFVGMDAFPLNANGKLARKDLLLPDQMDVSQSAYIAPRNETEQEICDLFSRILGIPKVGVEDDFFLMGGDSLGAITFLGECGKMGIRMDYRTLSECRTPEKLAENWLPKEDDEQILQAEQQAMKECWPLLEGQQLHYEMQKIAPESPFLNVPMLWRLKPEVDVNRLKAAVERVIALHPVLDIAVTEKDGRLFQQYCADYHTPVEILDVTEEELDKVRRLDGYRLSGLEKLYCFIIFRTPDAAWLFFNIHHVNCDGTSLQLIRDQICRCYLEDDPEIRPDYYFENVRRQTERKQDQAAVRAAAARYEEIMGDSTSWCKKAVILKTDTEGPAGGSALISAKDFARKNPAQDDSFFITAILRAMGRYNGTGEGMLWMIFSGRSDEMLRNTAGFAARYLPVYLNRDKNTRGLLTRQMECLKAYPELEEVIYPTDSFFEMLHFNHLGTLLEQGEIEALTETSEDLRIFDFIPGYMSIVLTDHPHDPGMDMDLYYSVNHYRRDSMEYFMKLILEEIHSLEAEEQEVVNADNCRV